MVEGCWGNMCNGVPETIKGSHDRRQGSKHPLLSSAVVPLLAKCIKLSDEEAEKIRKSTLSLTRPKTDGADDYVCQDCQEATGKKTTSESNVLLTPLTSFCRIRVYSHYPIMSSPTYTLLLRILLVGLVCSAILYAGFHVHGFWIAVSIFCV
jgi:hypothetical protein